MRTRYTNPLIAVIGVATVSIIGLNRLALPTATAGRTFEESSNSKSDVRLASAQQPAVVVMTVTPDSTISPRDAGPVAKLIRRDPSAVIKLARERYAREIRSYTCVFQKQERIDGKLRNTEQIEVRYREAPKAVYMIWKKNADQAKRVLFLDQADFVNKKGEKLAQVEPAGALIRLVVSDVMMPIHSKRASDCSLHPIDEFGFGAALDMLQHDNDVARKRGVLDFHYQGEGEVDGRPTYVLVRYLPYDGPNGIFPNAKLVMHLDQEWLLPTATYAYADREGRQLIGSYVYTDVQINSDLGADAFEF